MRHLIALALVLLLFVPPGCGGGGGGGGGSSSTANEVPAAATAMDSKLTSEMEWFMPRVPRYEGFLLFILNPGSPLAQGVTLTPDTSLGAPPFSFIFTGPYDGNEDGSNETTLSGRVTFNKDPAFDWTGLTGQVELDVAMPLVGHVIHANINYTITSAERLLSGSGKLTNPLTGNTTTMTMAAATPLVVKPATGAADAVSNACGYSLEGQMQLETTSSSGTLKSIWNFLSSSTSIVANNRTFTTPSGQTTMLPDSTFNAPCGGGGTINNWVGTYIQKWACLPREWGQSTITISVTGPNTVTILDENPPSPPITYTATTISGNPHALVGFYESGPMGFRYREDFYWTMRQSLSGFAQIAKYVYTEPQNNGKGGLCIASAPRN